MRLLWTALLLISACSATRLYDGPKRPAAETATVHVWSPQFENMPFENKWWFVRIAAVDGRELDGDVDTVEVLPGEHEVVVDWLMVDLFPDPEEGGRETFVVNARPGHRYVVTYNHFRSNAPSGFEEMPK
jgi:hypothetical protein